MLNKRITIIIALVGVILLSAVGTSFALFEKTETQTDNNTITTYNCLDVSINGGNAISMSAAYPIKDEEGILQTPYTFTITNNCDHYMGVDIGIEVQSTSTLSPSLIKAAISKGHDGIMPRLLTNYKLVQATNEETGLPTENAKYIMIHEGLPANDTQTFEYRMWIDYTAENITSTNKFDGKIVAIATVQTEEVAPNNWWTSNTINGSTTLLKAIRDNSIIRTPLTTPGQAINLENEALLASTQDDYGTSYYFRGNVQNNYVIFANKCWKIVRVLGNGAIKLFYWGNVTDNKCGEADKTNRSPIISNTLTYTKDAGGEGLVYQTASGVGFMYGKPDSTTLYTTNNTGAQDNISKSTILEYLEDWYEANLKTNYNTYLADVIWCGDKSIVEGNGYGQLNDEKSAFGSYERINYNFYLNKAIPSLICPNAGLDSNPTISKYTVEMNNTTKGNGYLDYPIGLITADEVAYAGGKYRIVNDKYYLYANTWTWTMSPTTFDGEDSGMWRIHSTGRIGGMTVNGNGGVFPSIALIPQVTISSGTGTATNPYVIKVDEI